ncbi:hypothetical protein C6382_12955 [Pseudomonas sp. BBP2017]|nr:hypothetical protein C6382_12955 [Pseudomonas sp. BBP2017]
MNIFGFSFLVLLSTTASLLLNRWLIKLRFNTWGVFFSLIYNSMMIAFYLDAAANRKLLRFQFTPDITDYYPEITIISMIMVFFHGWAFRTKA